MSTPVRRWWAIGCEIRGTAPGQQDIAWLPSMYPESRDALAEMCAVAVKFAEHMNGMSMTDRTVLDAVLVWQEQHPDEMAAGKSALVRTIAEVTGFTRPTVHASFDRLAEMGHGTRPPRGSGLRPFRATPQPRGDR